MKRLSQIVRLRSQALVALAALLLLASSFVYQPASPKRKLVFPQDHFSHPDFKTEWWYYTGHFETESGQSYGYQVTFFRFGLRDRQPQKGEPLFTDLHMAHFALSDKQGKKFVFWERANRGYRDQAGSATDRYLVWNEDWKVEAQGQNHVLQVRHQDVALRLNLTPLKRPALHGNAGYSQKGEGEGRASHYYSFTRLKTEGEFEIAGKTERIRGQSWMDHEFGSNQLAEDQVGWDWFSIQLDNNVDLMLYLIRRKDGSVDPRSSGTLIYETGSTSPLRFRYFQVEVLDRWTSPRSGATYPMKWRVTSPSEGIDLEITPFFPEQELDPRRSTKVTYWEGAAQVRGVFQDERVKGVGYVEMTGYAGKMKM